MFAAKELVSGTEAKMKAAIVALANEFKKIRTGRAQISMLDNVRVDYYGNPTPLNQVASVTTPDARSFLITPWEASVLKAIEQGIVKSDVGMAPINDGKVVRLRLPDLTEDRRKELVKQAKKVVEDGKVAVRMARRDANEALKVALKDKLISEDQNKQHLDEIQKLTDKYSAELDKVAAEKEKEIMTI
ncbi:MAG: ribosome recycling factor [Bdellovibrionaceae bacterium]|nr:ribosome recycling factor [Pseudobdellovibrionaceae bacterium]